MARECYVSMFLVTVDLYNTIKYVSSTKLKNTLVITTHLGVTKVTNFEAWRWVSIQERIFQFKVPVTYLLRE